MLEMGHFNNWLKDYWNSQVDIVPFLVYDDVKSQYLLVTKNEIDLSTLLEENGSFTVRENFILLLLEKWLFRQASILDIDYKTLYRNHYEGRTALIYRYLFNKESGYFHDFDTNSNKMVEDYNPIDQFFAYWLNLSSNNENAKQLLKIIDNNDPNLFIVFMGLRRLGLIKEANKIGQVIGFKVDEYNPNISTNTCPLLRCYNPHECLKMIKEAGFSYFDYSMESPNEFFTSDDYLENAKALKQYADSLGLSCNQTHSIFPVWHKTYEKEEVDKRIEYTKRILKISKILGAKNSVVHPINDFNEQQNFEFYQDFLPLAHELDINIATENMWNWEKDKASLAACSNHNNYKALIDLINDDHFCACVDIGHTEMGGLETSAVQMIEKLANKVTCLHIHDNDCHFDRHSLPLTEQIDFDLVLDALVRIDYQGDITFECDGFIDRMPKELHSDCLKLMYQVGHYLKGELLIRRKAICLKK